MVRVKVKYLCDKCGETINEISVSAGNIINAIAEKEILSTMPDCYISKQGLMICENCKQSKKTSKMIRVKSKIKVKDRGIKKGNVGEVTSVTPRRNNKIPVWFLKHTKNQEYNPVFMDIKDIEFVE